MAALAIALTECLRQFIQSLQFVLCQTIEETMHLQITQLDGAGWRKIAHSTWERIHSLLDRIAAEMFTSPAVTPYRFTNQIKRRCAGNAPQQPHWKRKRNADRIPVIYLRIDICECCQNNKQQQKQPCIDIFIQLFFSLPKATISENKEKIKVSSSMAISDDCSTEEDW